MLHRIFAPEPHAPRIEDPEEAASERRSMRLRTITWLTIGYSLAYTCRLGFSVVKKPLIDAGVYTAAELGWIGAAWKVSYGLGKLVNGFIADHASVRKLIPIGLGCSAVANLVMGATDLIFVAVVLWAFNGWFQGFLAPSCVVCLTRWFDGHERGTYYGIWSMAHSFGEGITFYGTALLVGVTTWRAAFWTPGVVCLAVAVVLYFVLRDGPESVGLDPLRPKTDDAPDDDGPGALKAQLRFQLGLLKNPAVWICGLASASMYVTRYAVNEWGMLYLQEGHQLSREMSATLITLNTIGGVGGSFAYGWISDKLFRARRPPVTLVFGVVEIVSLGLIFYGPTGNAVVIGAGMLLYGFTLAGLLAVLGGLFAVDMEPRAAGAAMGLVGCFSYLGAALQDLVSGELITAATTVSDAGVRQYDFTTPVTVWVGASVLSLVLATSLWKVRTKE